MRIWWKLLSISLVACMTSQVHACEKYDLPNVELTGTLRIETFYGPPNFGESPKTDAKERQAILHLAKPLCTIASNAADAEQNQLTVTVAPMDKLSLSQFVGKTVKVRGSLFHADNGHHHTPVLIEVHEAPVPLPVKSLR